MCVIFTFHSENNKPPVADAGPEKELTLPMDHTTLYGNKSHDDQKIATYQWTKNRSDEYGLMQFVFFVVKV